MPRTPEGGGWDELHRPFRTRAARLVGTALAGAMLVMVTVLALLLPGVAPERTTAGDRVGIVLFGIAVAVVLLRHAGVRADPDEDGLTVTNLVFRRRVLWPQVVSVRFGQGRPWVQLDLADGGTLAVMAVQAADGRFAREEARRLATLVAVHSRTSRDD